MEGKFPPNQSAKDSFVAIPKDCNHVNQTTFVGKVPKDPNPTKILRNSFESKVAKNFKQNTVTKGQGLVKLTG